MVNRLSSCNPDRLRAYLDGSLAAGDQAELAGHLDHCGACRRALERLAAGSRLWGLLPQLGRAEDPPTAGFPHGERPRGAAAREGLEFLAPSDDPACLGRLGPYEILGMLGEGGMGVVLKAYEPALHRVVAIKVLAPQMAASGAARRRFAREARAAAAVVHDHVVAIHAVDAEPHNGLPYLVMAYIAGQSLQQRIDREGPLHPEAALRIGMQTALGLAAAHAQGLVHRDIKPSNILLENGLERVKITDFGLARAVDDASQSQSGFVAGTPQYMSPEQARGEATDHRADLFSLGSVLYAMCAGHSPFRAKTTMGVLRRVSDDTPRPLGEINPEVPRGLEAIIGRLHAKDPSRRHQSATEVAEALGKQLALLQRPGARPARRAPGRGLWPSKQARPISKTAKAKAPEDGPSRTRPARSRVATFAATALLLVFGLAVAGASDQFAFLQAPPAPAAPAAPAEPAEPTKPGERPESGRSPAQVIITDRKDDDRTIVGSGKPATKRWDLADFTGVEVMHPFRAELSRGDRFEVSVTADDNVLEHILAAKEGPRLTVRLEDNRTYRLRRDSLKVAITLPALESLALSHGARASVAGFESKRPFEAKLQHGGLLEGTIGAGRLVLETQHGSTVALKGTAESARIEAAHGSSLPLGGMVIGDAEIELAHGSSATINARPGKGLRAEVTHGANLAGEVQGGEIKLEAGHGSRVTLKGSARGVTIEGGHASRFSLGELALDTADVHLDHSSAATVNAKSKLDYVLGHSSHLKYLGQPAIGRSQAGRGSSARAVKAEDLKGPAGAEPSAKAGPSPAADPSSARPREDGSEVITISLNSGVGRGPAIEGSGRRATKAVDIKDFTAIQIDRLIIADVTRADAFGVSVSADDNILEKIEAVRDGSTLRIGLPEGHYRLRERPHATITLPVLDAIDVGGVSRATIQGFATDRPFRAKVRGASSLEGTIRAGEADLDASGASTLTLRGSAKGARLVASGASKLELADLNLEAGNVTVEAGGASSAKLRGSAQAAVLKANGASRLALADLALEAADVSLSGASHATVRVKHLLNYDVSSASGLEYLGEPKIGKSGRTGASSVTHR